MFEHGTIRINYLKQSVDKSSHFPVDAFRTNGEKVTMDHLWMLINFPIISIDGASVTKAKATMSINAGNKENSIKS